MNARRGTARLYNASAGGSPQDHLHFMPQYCEVDTHWVGYQVHWVSSSHGGAIERWRWPSLQLYTLRKQCSHTILTLSLPVLYDQFDN